jgi:hypothetical protein
MPDRCILCKSSNRLDPLLSVCLCAKKSDVRMHKSCLEFAIMNNPSEEPLTCPKCKQNYSVKLNWIYQADWSLFFTGKSLSHAFEFIVVVLMILCMAYTIYSFYYSPQQIQARKHNELYHNPANNSASVNSIHSQHHSADDRADFIIYFLFFIVVLMIPITLRTVYHRWKRANSKSQIIGVV